MLATIDIPEHLENIHQECKEIATRIVEELADVGTRTVLEGNANLVDWEEPTYFFIHDGFFRVAVDEKLVRFYYNNDFVLAEASEILFNASITSDFGTEVTLFPRDKFLDAIVKKPHLMKEWNRFQENENRINLVLASLYMTEEIRPKVKVKNFKPGEVIIQEDDLAEKIFLLVDGEAEVDVKGTIVGKIEAGEFFGEIAFLLKQKRNATILAATNCLVQIIDWDNFVLMIRHRPQLILNITRTLAKRVSDLNDRLFNTTTD
jgi:hypothetical protein